MRILLVLLLLLQGIGGKSGIGGKGGTGGGVVATVPTLVQLGISTTDGVFVASVPSHAAGGIVCVKEAAGLGIASAIVNTAGYTWTLEVTNSIAAGSYDLQIWCSPTTNFGSTDTVTVTNASAIHGGIIIEDWANATSVAATDTNSDGTGAFTSVTTNAISYTGANGVVSVIGRPNGGGDLTGTGMTSQSSVCPYPGGGGCSFWGFDAFNLAAYKLTTGSPVTAVIGASTFWDTAAVVIH